MKQNGQQQQQLLLPFLLVVCHQRFLYSPWT